MNFNENIKKIISNHTESNYTFGDMDPLSLILE